MNSTSLSILINQTAQGFVIGFFSLGGIVAIAALFAIECVQQRFAEHVIELVESCGVSSQMINIEVTETAAPERDDVLRHTMDTRIAVHPSFAPDDYGMGFASSSKYQFKFVKLDRSILWGASG